jgi:hypothetical protein
VGLLVGRTHLSGTAVSLVGGDPGVPISHNYWTQHICGEQRTLGTSSFPLGTTSAERKHSTQATLHSWAGKGPFAESHLRPSRYTCAVRPDSSQQTTFSKTKKFKSAGQWAHRPPAVPPCCRRHQHRRHQSPASPPTATTTSNITTSTTRHQHRRCHHQQQHHPLPPPPPSPAPPTATTSTCHHQNHPRTSTPPTKRREMREREGWMQRIRRGNADPPPARRRRCTR